MATEHCSTDELITTPAQIRQETGTGSTVTSLRSQRVGYYLSYYLEKILSWFSHWIGIHLIEFAVSSNQSVNIYKIQFRKYSDVIPVASCHILLESCRRNWNIGSGSQWAHRLRSGGFKTTQEAPADIQSEYTGSDQLCIPGGDERRQTAWDTSRRCARPLDLCDDSRRRIFSRTDNRFTHQFGRFRRVRTIILKKRYSTKWTHYSSSRQGPDRI